MPKGESNSSWQAPGSSRVTTGHSRANLFGPAAAIAGLLALLVVPAAFFSSPNRGTDSLESSSPENSGSPLWTLALSPDGRWLASARMNGNVELKDLRAGEKTYLNERGAGLTRTLTFSPDSRTLILGNEGAPVRPETQTKPGVAGGPDLMVVAGKSITFCRDGTRLALYLPDEAKICVLEWPTRRLLAEFPCDSVGARCLAFSPDGQDLTAALNTGEVITWRLSTRTQRLRFHASHQPITGFAYVMDGEMITTACGNHPDLEFWASADGRRLERLAGDGWGVIELDVSADRRFLAMTCADGKGRVIDLKSRRIAAVFPGPGGVFRALAFTADGRSLAVAGPKREIYFWPIVADGQSGVRTSTAPARS